MNQPLIEKIKKLLRLGNDRGATAAEAALALAKAQQLAAENGISLSEIGGEEEGHAGLTHVTVPSQAGLPHKLASGLIKRHFGVDTLFDSTGDKATMHIIGTPSQAQLAEYVYVYLVRALRQSWQKRENRRLKNRESFLRGFAHAISSQLPAVFPQTGLILSCQHYIEDKLLRPGEKLKTLSISKKTPTQAAFHEGLRAGRQTGIRNALRGSETLNLNWTMITVQELADTATALLATVKKVMSGREIDACEWAKTDQAEDDWCDLHYGDCSDAMRFFGEDTDGELNAFQEHCQQTALKISLIESLANQFPSEIRNWTDMRQRAQARRATKAFA